MRNFLLTFSLLASTQIISVNAAFADQNIDDDQIFYSESFQIPTENKLAKNCPHLDWDNPCYPRGATGATGPSGSKGEKGHRGEKGRREKKDAERGEKGKRERGESMASQVRMAKMASMVSMARMARMARMAGMASEVIVETKGPEVQEVI